jgi:hypothetical protein
VVGFSSLSNILITLNIKMPKRKFDEFLAPAGALLEAIMTARVASFEAKMCVYVAESCIAIEMYGPRAIGVVPRIQAFFRGILTRKRVHFALLSAEPDAVEYALCLCGAL